MNPDRMTPKEKIVVGIETLKNFFDSVGGPSNDIYKQILLEELIKILMEGKDGSIHLSVGPKS